MKFSHLSVLTDIWKGEDKYAKILHPILPQGKVVIKQRNLCFKEICPADIDASLILSSSPALPASLSFPGSMPEQGLLVRLWHGRCNG